METESQIFREIKDILIWLLVPLTCLVVIAKIFLNWYHSGQFDLTTILLLVGILLILSLCWIAAKQRYERWLKNVRLGVSQSGTVLYDSAPSNSLMQALKTIVVVVLLTLLAYVFRADNVESIFILIYAGVVWMLAVSTYMASTRSIVGSQGIWTSYLGLKIFVGYSSIGRVAVKQIDSADRIQITLNLKNLGSSRYTLPTLFPRNITESLEQYVMVEKSDG